MTKRHNNVVINFNSGCSARSNKTEFPHQEVGLIEVIGHVPSDLSILAPFLHNSMEKGQHIHQATECWMVTTLQSVIGDLKVGSAHVQL